MIESSPEIYIADMTLRAQNVRSIEMTPCQQQSPDGKGIMDSLKFENPNILSVDFAIFDDMFITMRYKHFTGINFYATNQAVIIDDLRIRPVI